MTCTQSTSSLYHMGRSFPAAQTSSGLSAAGPYSAMPPGLPGPYDAARPASPPPGRPTSSMGQASAASTARGCSARPRCSPSQRHRDGSGPQRPLLSHRPMKRIGQHLLPQPLAPCSPPRASRDPSHPASCCSNPAWRGVAGARFPLQHAKVAAGRDSTSRCTAATLSAVHSPGAAAAVARSSTRDGVGKLSVHPASQRHQDGAGTASSAVTRNARPTSTPRGPTRPRRHAPRPPCPAHHPLTLTVFST